MYMKRQPIGSLLDAWYGREQGKAEKIRYLPNARKVSEVVESVMERALPPGTFDFLKVVDAWPQIAGAEISARATPFKLENGRLFVEISHPAWLVHFRSPQVKKALIAKVQDLIGKPACYDIVFLPAGRMHPGQ